MSLQNYPNPFNPSTTISFNAENAEDAEIIIYNLKGQKVRTLESATPYPGMEDTKTTNLFLPEFISIN